MHPWDKEKTTFVTDGANYYYKVMLFGLKNAEATYQRLMDKIFKGLISRCVEVYVDDIVVKFDSCEQHIKDLEKVFKALRRTNMRLHFEKCAFEVERGKFKDFMLTHWWIEANSDDCRDAEPPKLKGSPTIDRASHHPLYVRPSAGRENQADGATAPQGIQV